jgi:probable H4MPT-linked C1 transfer pathway protein
MTITAGLDVGGAHLKLALVENGTPIIVEQYACPLWQGLDKLDTALAIARPLVQRADSIAVTMTGELSDLFETRQQGVAKLVEWLSRALGDDIRFWQGARGFGTADCAIEHFADVGSTNFLATATLVGKRLNHAMLLDFGSTTADIIPIIDGRPCPGGLSDATRQMNGELVYTGLTRTAIMGVAQQAPFKGNWVGFAREYLATMADVRRILGELDPNVDLHATADGRGKSVAESTQRLARMLGRDACEGGETDWRITARYIAECQTRSIYDGLVTVLSRHPRLGGETLVCAGIGADVGAGLASRLGLKSATFGELAGLAGSLARAATHCAPATAVAMLLDHKV